MSTKIKSSYFWNTLIYLTQFRKPIYLFIILFSINLKYFCKLIAKILKLSIIIIIIKILIIIYK